MNVRAEIGVIGGTGLYEFLDATAEVTPETPYGPPSDPVVIGDVAGRSVAFLPRHGRAHQYPPHRIPYHANMWALRSLGVRQVLAPTAVGSLSAEFGPGTLAIPDQLVDRTTGRSQTFFDDGAAHVAFADPYCPRVRAHAAAVARAAGWQPLDRATLVVIDGPRFSTRAESQWYAGRGWTLIGMTGHPEAVLAREMALCYTALGLVTDLDAGLTEGEGVRQEDVFQVFGDNVTRLRDLLYAIIGGLTDERTCPCRHALDGIKLPFDLP